MGLGAQQHSPVKLLAVEQVGLQVWGRDGVVLQLELTTHTDRVGRAANAGGGRAGGGRAGGGGSGRLGARVGVTTIDVPRTYTLLRSGHYEYS